MSAKTSSITVDLNGNWRLYTRPNGDLSMLGTVTRDGNDIGALAQWPNGLYIQINDSNFRSLDQRKIKAALGISNNAGAPVKLDGGFKRCNLSLDAETREIFSSLGKNMSDGARIAAKIAQSHNK